MWPRSDLSDLLGIEHPIIQAPMAGASTPAMAAAVSNAGGLGSLGCAAYSLDQLRNACEAVRASTNGPYNLNFFVHEAPAAPADDATPMRERLAAYYEELGIAGRPALDPIMPPFDAAMLEVVLAARPKVVSFHFGLPAPELLAPLKEAGAIVLGSATTVTEARRLEAGGVDAIIAQGFEAGGHRGTFAIGGNAGEVGTMALVPQVVDAVSVPVIAAGGIADGRGIAAAFALGASGAQIGTAFLSCPEAGISPAYRQALAAVGDDATRLTRAFSGRLARAIGNRFVAEMAAHQEAAAPFPLQRRLVAPLTAAAEARGSADFTSLWAGQAVPLSRAMPAAELFETLVAEAQAILRR
jgi:nitronate monooxygenase